MTMSIAGRSKNFLASLREKFSVEEVTRRLCAVKDAPAVWRTIPTNSARTINYLWQKLAARGVGTDVKQQLADEQALQQVGAYNANIENMIGTVKIPVGLVGPLQVNGLHAKGDYLIPLATTEATLVASYNRGAKAVNQAGGVVVTTLSNTVLRSPVFRFANVIEAGLFIEWLDRHEALLKQAAEATTAHGKLVFLYPMMDGELVYLICGYSTGDASGQNMVTFASEALCLAALSHCPTKPQAWFVEGNLSGDKKASFLSVLQGRGRKTTAQVDLSHKIVEKILGVDVSRFLEYVRIGNLGSLMAGQVGAQAHYANGLAALFLATGQDVACVSETSIGFTRAEMSQTGLKFTVTLPNLMVGTVGGGTNLPSQRAGLELMGLYGTGKANAFSEVAAALVLCGELSLTAAVASGQFSAAHHKLARKRQAS